MVEAFPDPVAARFLNECGGDFNRAVTALVARHWTKDEAESELRLCLRSEQARSVIRASRRAQSKRASNGRAGD